MLRKFLPGLLVLGLLGCVGQPNKFIRLEDLDDEQPILSIDGVGDEDKRTRTTFVLKKDSYQREGDIVTWELKEVVDYLEVPSYYIERFGITEGLSEENSFFIQDDCVDGRYRERGLESSSWTEWIPLEDVSEVGIRLHQFICAIEISEDSFSAEKSVESEFEQPEKSDVQESPQSRMIEDEFSAEQEEAIQEEPGNSGIQGSQSDLRQESEGLIPRLDVNPSPVAVKTAPNRDIITAAEDSDTTNATVDGDPEFEKNVRAEVSTESEVLFELSVGDRIQVLEGPMSSDNYEWYRIYSPDEEQEGWMAGQLLLLDESADIQPAFFPPDIMEGNFRHHVNLTVDSDIYAQISQEALLSANVDLNGDGYIDIVASVDRAIDSKFCGANNGCSIDIFVYQNSRFRSIWSHIGFIDSFRISNVMSNGFRDIALNISDDYHLVYGFNGIQYERSYYQDGSRQIPAIKAFTADVSEGIPFYIQPDLSSATNRFPFSQVLVVGEWEDWLLVHECPGMSCYAAKAYLPSDSLIDIQE